MGEMKGMSWGETGGDEGDERGRVGNSLVRSSAPRNPARSEVATTKRRAVGVGSEANRDVFSPAPNIFNVLFGARGMEQNLLGKAR